MVQPSACHVLLDRSVTSLTGPQFSHLCNVNDNSNHLMVVLCAKQVNS